MGQNQSVIILANRNAILKSVTASKESSLASWKERHGEPDLVLVVSRTRFPVHRKVLIENSAYFR